MTDLQALAEARRVARYYWPTGSHIESFINEAEAALKAEAAEQQAVFDLRYKADMRAIKAWQGAHPDREDVWPDHADMVVWLMERMDTLSGLAYQLAYRLWSHYDGVLWHRGPVWPKDCEDCAAVAAYREWRSVAGHAAGGAVGDDVGHGQAEGPRLLEAVEGDPSRVPGEGAAEKPEPGADPGAAEGGT